MDNLIILAGILAILRGYWTFNLVRIENGTKEDSFFNFISSPNVFSYYLIIRPFYREMKDENLKKKVNFLTYIIYISFVIGIYFVFHSPR